MKINELKEIISGLAKSQGSYGRFKNALDVGDNWERLLEYCNENNINNAVDLVMALEN